jgi:hypothetical protein
MTTHDTEDALLSEIEGFLAETGMGPAYFGKSAVGNTEIVKRLRNGRSVTLATARSVRDFMAKHRQAEEVMQ